MGGIHKTAENLEVAIKGEGFDFNQMYPPYLEEAKREGDRIAEMTFRNALAVRNSLRHLLQGPRRREERRRLGDAAGVRLRDLR